MVVDAVVLWCEYQQALGSISVAVPSLWFNSQINQSALLDIDSYGSGNLLWSSEPQEGSRLINRPVIASGKFGVAKA